MLCSKDFYNRCKWNSETQEQLWTSIIGDVHESICSCKFPFAHLLSIIFPLGHQDRNKTINQILARDFKEKCLSSGGGDAASGIPTGETTTEKEDTAAEDIKQEDAAFADLLAAVEEEEGTR